MKRIGRGEAASAYAIEFAIAGLPKTPNAMLGAHWTIRSGHAKKWRKAVETAVMLNGGPPATPLLKARIACSRRSSGRMDNDGLVGSFKAIVDALVRCKVLADDTPDHVAITYRQEKAPPGKGGITVRVEEA